MGSTASRCDSKKMKHMPGTAKLFSCVIAVLISILGTPPIANGYEATNSYISFPAHGEGERGSLIFLSPSDKKEYKLTLDPDFDVSGSIITLTLLLQEDASPEDSPNLLETTPGEHGYQKYIFVASDFRNWPERTQSPYGSTRTIFAKKIKSSITASVRDAKIECNGEKTCTFLSISLQISISTPNQQ